MKKLTTCFLIMVIACTVSAQSSVTSVSYNKKNQPGLMLELPYSESVSEDFIVSNLKKTGYDAETKGKLFWKQNKLNGFYIFKEVQLQGLEHTVDLYFKVDQRGKKSREESVIYMLVGRGEDYFIPSSDDKVYDAAKRFMNMFIEEAAAYKLDLDIEEQEKTVKSAEKKLSDLSGDEKSMLKKIEQLEKDLRKNKEDQEKQAKLIEEEKKKLENLRQQKS
ncbi:MAG: hypothetical protein ACXWV0_04410 [Flavisolibacter sp.]